MRAFFVKGIFADSVVLKLRKPPATGDWVIFGSADKSNIWFQEVAEVINAESLPVSEQETSRYYRLSVKKLVNLPENRTLRQLMFSLERIYNFLRPTMHIRTGSVISQPDLKTILTGRIHIPRTVYFGLLQRLPSAWRNKLMAESEARRQTDRYGDLENPPAQELVYPFLNNVRILDGVGGPSPPKRHGILMEPIDIG